MRTWFVRKRASEHIMRAVTPCDIARSGPMADALLMELDRLPSGLTAGALAIALGRIAEQAGIPLMDIFDVLEAAYAASRDESHMGVC